MLILCGQRTVIRPTHFWHFMSFLVSTYH